MRFRFLHAHGSGNDFPLIDARDLALADGEWATVARALADRAGPVGGDGLLLLTAGDEAHAFGMAMRNSDGSQSEQCLNGLRCVARAGFEALEIDHATVRLQTSSAQAWAEAPLAPGVTTIGERARALGGDVTAWPLHASADVLIEAPLPMLSATRTWTAVAMPNPHLIAFVDAVDDAELSALGAICEAAPDWLPNRANVSFVAARGATALFVRTCERGVGLTNSCGSAMAAAVHAAALTGRVAWDVPVTVFNAGGRVVATAARDGLVTIAGNATWEWAGEIDVDLATGIASDLVVTHRFEDEQSAWAAVVG